MNDKIDHSAVTAWLRGATTFELIDVLETARSMYDKKQNEDRVTTVEVIVDDIRIASFNAGEQIKALEYLISHKDEIEGSEIQLRNRRVVKSEMEAELRERWWND
ncbi:hypothetical protein U4I94_02390 [Stenotrophomonas maltophilia]|uniref:hypothetical protein n=1 Tax=Stenotrophomonas maltophilia TaxID=40324 RepID=UPI002ACC9530|nr:hypothetical protein [Stenotrophomonas maltophilia]MDZ5773275.1 hypothetical protein [Stenotrophomonas maltophilia]